jgi:hypothetical protein
MPEIIKAAMPDGVAVLLRSRPRGLWARGKESLLQVACRIVMMTRRPLILRGRGPMHTNAAKTYWVVLGAICILCAASAGGCAVPEYSGFLTPYEGYYRVSWLNQDQEYVRPGVNWRAYRRVRIAPVVMYVRPGSEAARAPNLNELRQASSLLESRLMSAFGGHYRLTTQPGPDVLEVRAAITRLRPTDQAVNAAVWVAPYSFLFTSGYTMATNSNLALGEAGIEVEFADSMVGTRQYGFVGLHMGSSLELEQTSRWGIPEKALGQWAESLSDRLQELQAP